ncbi:MAG: hypothetical protein JXA13_14195 [Anaerolineales bacterium]|nr:hypothetical protein [Anaerolineales bacterium]
MSNLANRFPQKEELYYIYSVACFLVYTWAIFVFLYFLPGLILNTSQADLFAVFCYGSTIVQLDVLLFTLLAILVILILPPKYTQNKKVAIGAIVVFILFFATLILQALYNIYSPGLTIEILAFLFLMALSGFTVFATIQSESINHTISKIAKRLSLVTFIYVPLWLVSLVVVVIRNL